MATLSKTTETLAEGQALTVAVEGFEVIKPGGNLLKAQVVYRYEGPMTSQERPRTIGVTSQLQFFYPMGPASWMGERGVTLVGKQGPSHPANFASLIFDISRETVRLIDESVSRDYGLRYSLFGDLLFWSDTVGMHNHRFCAEGLVSNDDWRRLRVELGLDTRRMFEISAASFSSVDEMDEAHKLLQQADLDLASGRYDDCARRSRMVMDSIMRRLGFVDPKGKRWHSEAVAKDLREVGLGEGVAEGIEQIIRGFSIFTSAASHPDSFKWGRVHAEFALNSAASLASLVGSLPSRIV